MTSMAQVSHAMYTLLTTNADELGRSSGLVQRQRKLDGSHLAQILVLGSLADANAPLSRLVQTAAGLGVGVRRQALAQRQTETAAAFLRQLLERAVAEVVVGEPVALALLQRFGAVVALDSTILALPPCLAAEWPGCGGSTPTAGAAALKLTLRFDLLRGGLGHLSLQAGRTSDQTTEAQTAALEADALRLSDLGFFSAVVLTGVAARAGHFLCRPKATMVVVDHQGRRWRLRELLAARCRRDFDEPVTLGTKQPLPCRLLARRVPEAIAALRRQRLVEAARQEGVRPSPAQLALVHWEVFVTDLAPERLSLDEAVVVARLRWQIELLFKRWKSLGAIDEPRSQNAGRVLCMIYAKLLAVLLEQWIVVASCWALPAKSLYQAAQTVRLYAVTLLCPFRQASRRRLSGALRALGQCIVLACPMGTNRNHPYAYQRLLALEEAA